MNLSSQVNNETKISFYTNDKDGGSSAMIALNAT